MPVIGFWGFICAQKLQGGQFWKKCCRRLRLTQIPKIQQLTTCDLWFHWNEKLRFWQVWNEVSHVPDPFSVGRVCFAVSLVDFQAEEGVPPWPGSIFWLAECVPPRPGSIFSHQSMFRHVPGRFPVGRVCSANFRVDFPLFSQNALRKKNQTSKI